MSIVTYWGIIGVAAGLVDVLEDVCDFLVVPKLNPFVVTGSQLPHSG